MASLNIGFEPEYELISAARSGAVAAVREMLDAGVDVDFQDERTSALIAASKNGLENVVKLLLQRGAQVDVKNKQGLAAIHEAASEGHDSVVRLLLEGGADIDICTDTGSTAIGIAEEKGHHQIVQMLVGFGAPAPFKERLIIGFDFGMYSSSVAYGFDGMLENSGAEIISCITSWPGEHRQHVHNVPTVIEYDRDETHLFTWGYQVSRDSISKLECLKYLLDLEQPQPLSVLGENARKMLQKLGKSPVDAVSDYIGALYKNALDYITSSFPEEYVHMHQATKLAGIYEITLVNELAAVTYFALHHFSETLDLKIGDAFILCHVSEKFVYVASFEYSTPGSGLKEITTTLEGLSGSSMLSNRFGEFIQDIIGDEAYLQLRKSIAYSYALRQFNQEVVPSFTANSDKEWFIAFPWAGLEDDLDNNIQAGTLCLKSEAVQQIFEPIIQQAVKLVQVQIDKLEIKRLAAVHPKGNKIRAIFLVNDYEYGSIPSFKLALQDANPTFPIMEPPEPRRAIAKGAVLSQIPLQENISMTQATKHIGIISRVAYDESLHALLYPRLWDGDELRFYIMEPTWIIRIGDDLMRGQRIKFSCRQKLPSDLDDGNSILEQSVVTCSDIDLSPSSPVRTLCRLEMDLKNLPVQDLKGFKGGFIYYVLVVQVRRVNLVFSIEVNGKEMMTNTIYD